MLSPFRPLEHLCRRERRRGARAIKCITYISYLRYASTRESTEGWLLVAIQPPTEVTVVRFESLPWLWTGPT